MTADLHGISTVALVGSYELDAAVPLPVVVPVNKRRHPLAGSLRASKWPDWAIRTVFGRPEQRFRVGVVIRHPWSGEGPEHTLLLQPTFQRGYAQLFEKPAARRCRCRRGGSAAASVFC